MIVETKDIDVTNNEAVMKDGKSIGYITSGGYAHYVKKSIDYSYLDETICKPNEKFQLNKLMKVDKDYAEKFYQKKLVATVYLLHELKKSKYTKHILRFLANDNINSGSEVLAAKLATDISRFDFSIQVSKIASYQKRFHNKYNYPIISTPTKVGKRKIPESALIL